MVGMVGGNNNRIHQTLMVMNSNLLQSFSKVKEEMDEHLQSINENTIEIEHQHDTIFSLEEKMEKLSMRMDTIQMMFTKLIMQTRVSVQLSDNEQSVFALLFEFTKYIPLKYVAEKTSLSETDLEESLPALRDQRIPVEQRTIGDKAYLKMDADFRELQMREHIVKINPSVMQRMENKMLASFF